MKKISILVILICIYLTGCSYSSQTNVDVDSTELSDSINSIKDSVINIFDSTQDTQTIEISEAVSEYRVLETHEQIISGTVYRTFIIEDIYSNERWRFQISFPNQLPNNKLNYNEWGTLVVGDYFKFVDDLPVQIN